MLIPQIDPFYVNAKKNANQLKESVVNSITQVYFIAYVKTALQQLKI